jgi:hypothetical protein
MSITVTTTTNRLFLISPDNAADLFIGHHHSTLSLCARAALPLARGRSRQPMRNAFCDGTHAVVSLRDTQ